MPRTTEPTIIDLVRRRFLAGESKSAIARGLGLHRQTVIDACKGLATPSSTAPSEPPPPPEPGVVKRTESGDTLALELVSDRIIRTEAEALAFAEVDLSAWKVDRMEVTAWPVTMKLSQGKGQPDRVLTKQLFRVHLKLSRVQPKPVQELLGRVYGRFAELEIRWPKPDPKPRIRRRPCKVELNLFDVHFAKMAWARETGQDQDLKLTDALFRNAVADMLDECVGRDVEGWVLAMGQDYFHTDGSKSETSNGTRVDCDSRYWKMIEVGTEAFVWAVERARRTAPVWIPYVAGNHDALSSGHVAHTVKGIFRSARDVEVDTEPTKRKYLHYGASLIGYSHGDETGAKVLAGLMPNERPAAWAETACHQWRCGHKHTRSLEIATKMDTHHGVEVWRLSSLSAADAWHSDHGFKGNVRAAEAFILDKAHGYRGHFLIPARAS